MWAGSVVSPAGKSIRIGVVNGSVQIDQKSYEMPPKDGISIAHFLTVPTSTDRSITTRRSSARAF